MSEMNIVNLGNKKESKMYDKRLIVYGVVENMEADPTALKKLKPLYMYQDHLEFINPYHDQIIIDARDIDKVVLKMCGRMKIFGFFSENNFYLDLDVHVKENIYKFEVPNMQTANNIIDYLKHAPFTVEDYMDVYAIFEKHPDCLARTRYLQANFKKIAKKYGLDFPRQGGTY